MLIAQHLGADADGILIMSAAAGVPFVILALVVFFVSRRDRAEEAKQAAEQERRDQEAREARWLIDSAYGD